MNLQSKYRKDNVIHTHSVFHVVWKKIIVQPNIFKICISHGPPPTKENDNRTTLAFTVKALLITAP